MRSRSSVVSVLLLAGLAGAVAGEAVLQVWKRSVGFSLNDFTQPHPQLGLVVAPNSPGHDAQGFRNERTPQRADLVFIGDSQVYGLGVSQREALPSAVGEQLGRSAYNLALGGYALPEYAYLYEHYGRALHPEAVVVGLSLSTDLVDVVRAVDRLPGLGFDPAPIVGAAPDVTRLEDTYGAMIARLRPTSGQVDEFLRNAKLYGLVTRLVNFYPTRTHAYYRRWEERIRSERDRLSEDERWLVDRGLWLPYQDENVRTIFRPMMRLIAVLSDSEQIRASMRVSEEALLRLHEAAAQDGARLLLVFLPTKEEVYYPYLKQRGAELPASMDLLASHTAAVRGGLIAFMDSRGIEHVDCTRELSEAASAGEPVFPTGEDGHATARGNAIIAEVVAKRLREGRS
jgi:hypothetical protein